MKNRILTTIILLVLAFVSEASTYHTGAIFKYGPAYAFPPTYPLAQQDNKIGFLPNTPGFVNTDVISYIRLEFDYSSTQQTLSAFHHQYQITYDEWDNQGMQNIGQTVNLEIKYDPNFGTNILDRDAVYLKDKHGIQITGVTIIDVNTGLPAPNPATWDYTTMISLGVKIERYFEVPYGAFICPSAVPQDLDGDTKHDVLDISWTPPVPDNFAESYDLEYTFVDDYTAVLGTYKPSAAIAYDFKHNSTRVNVINPFYRINLVFDHGYLIYRVRPVGRDKNDPTKIVYGDWSIVLDQGADLNTL